MVSRFWKYMKNIIFYVSLIKNDKQKKEKKLTFLNHLLALDNVFSTKSEEQEVNLMWPNLFLIFDCPSSVYTARDHDLFRTLSKWISVAIKIIGQVCLRGSELKKSYIEVLCLKSFLVHLNQRSKWSIAITWCPSSVVCRL